MSDPDPNFSSISHILPRTRVVNGVKMVVAVQARKRKKRLDFNRCRATEGCKGRSRAMIRVRSRVIVPVSVLSETSMRGRCKIDKALININLTSTLNPATSSNIQRSSRVTCFSRRHSRTVREVIVLLDPIPLPFWFVGGSD